MHCPRRATQDEAPSRSRTWSADATRLANKPHSCARFELRGVRARFDAHVKRVAIMIPDGSLCLPRRELSNCRDLGHHTGHQGALSGHLDINRAADRDAVQAILTRVE